jgi:hypothetical protein
VRSALYRHRMVEDDPIFLVAWQNGFDPFAACAIAIGKAHAAPELFVMTGARDLDSEAREYGALATRFCALFDAYGIATDTMAHQGRPLEVPVWLPQVIVPNSATVQLLGRIGRRLARAEHRDRTLAGNLRRFAGHLLWLVRHADLPGQQILLPLTEYLNAHYRTAMSMLECQSLFALDAWIDPPEGMRGFEAAGEAERRSAGPALKPEDAAEAARLLSLLDEARKRGSETDPRAVRARAALTDLYCGITEPAWRLLIRIARRERGRPAAAYLSGRADRDRIAYALHLDRLERALGFAYGIPLTESAREAALRRDELERAAELLQVEEALDDPLRMLPLILTGEAVEGTVLTSELREESGARVVLRTDERCLLPPGTQLWWTGRPSGQGWCLESVEPVSDGSRLTFGLRSLRNAVADVPRRGARAVFSPLHFDDHLTRGISLPARAPWTHRTARSVTSS